MKFIEKRVLGLIPARGGSKGIPNKNRVSLGGVPLIHWAAKSALASGCLNDFVVSSDDIKIIKSVERLGVQAHFVRPKKLSRDNTLVIDVVKHALDWFEEYRRTRYEYVCLVQPTSPFGLPEDYKKAVNLALRKNADTVVSVYECGQKHPQVAYCRDKDGSTQWFLPEPEGGRMSRRQDLPPVYLRSGVVYVIKSDLIRNKNTLYGNKIFSIVLPEERVLDINTPLDLEMARFLAKKIKKETRF